MAQVTGPQLEDPGAGRGGAGAGAGDVADPGDTSSTRERILDVALDLFTVNGFDATSLREIADRVGVTKAALYYHFASKDDILMALHMRIHEVGRAGLEQLAEGPVTVAAWESLIETVLDQVLVQRKLFVMHERNQAAVEKLHSEGHDAEHADLGERLRQVLADPSVTLRDRVRMAASFGALFAVVIMAADTFAASSDAELGVLLREVIRSVLAG